MVIYSDIDLVNIDVDIRQAMDENTYELVTPQGYLTECFDVETGSGCDWMRITDKTVYNLIPDINTSLSTIYVSLYKLTNCGADELIEGEDSYATGSTWQYNDLEPGCYELRFRLYYYTDKTDEYFTKYVTIPVTLDCCAVGKDTFKTELREKIAEIACRINTAAQIGKPNFTLMHNMYVLQAILFATCTCFVNCTDLEQFRCTANKIITNCNC
jgi:hypothetical protein